MVLNSFGLVLLVIASGSAYVLLENDDPKESILWPSEFYYSSEIIDLTNAFIENNEVWYSGENNRSRIDYFNGTNKVYYYAETEDDMGCRFTIHPVSTEEQKNEIMCVSRPISGAQPDFLPEIDNYIYSHQTELNGKSVQVWKIEEADEGNVRVEATVFVYRTDYDFDIPLQRNIYVAFFHKNVSAYKADGNPSAATADKQMQSYTGKLPNMWEKKVFDLTKGEIIYHSLQNFKRFNYIIDVNDVTYNGDDSDCYDSLSLDFRTELATLYPRHSADVEAAFHSYKIHHNKNYKINELALRKAIFHENWKRVVAHNSKNFSYKMEINHLSDRTDEELQYLTGTRPSDPLVQGTIPFPHGDEELELLQEQLPETYDLRLEGFLGPIKNQGSCGSCWAFATTATVEGMTSKFYGGRNVDLSEQSLVDCSWGFENMGCNGGELASTYEYILKHGIPTEHQYGEYLRKDGYCHLDNDTETFKIKGFSRVTPNNPTALKVALVKYGPVAVAIHVSSNMKSYANGVFYDIDCDDTPNHGVVVVGYGARDGTPFWIVRNSWGESFGMNGYILMSALNNNCRVMDTPFYPIV